MQNKIAVQLIHPGPTKTGMHAKAGLEKLWIQHLFRKPDKVALDIIWAINSNRETVKLGSVRYRLNMCKKHLIDFIELYKTFRLKKYLTSRLKGIT